MKHALIVAFLSLAPGLAAAQDCALTYDTYEFSVPHTDLAECPADMAAEDRFCRATFMADVLTVWSFSAADAQCLVETREIAQEGYTFEIR